MNPNLLSSAFNMFPQSVHQGDTINQYQILDRIGEGGMGVVYLADDTRLGRKVALKFVSNASLDSSEEIARFHREARAAARLNHPNICTVYEMGETGDKTYIAMEYVDGITLKERIRQGNISEEEIRNWLRQIAEGLHVAHEAGIIHRDIKPANIMITDSGLIKIMDFGIAKLVESDTELTRANSTMGTIAYMSPEQARGEEIARQTDIWSIGVILYELTTGKRPFEGAFREAVMYAMMHADPVPPSTLNPELSSDLNDIIEGCLQREVEKRYTSLNDLLNTLASSSGFPTKNSASLVDSSQGAVNQKVAEKVARNYGKFSVNTRAFSRWVGIAIISMASIGIGYYFVIYQNNVKRAQQELLPQIENLVQEINYMGEGPSSWNAYNLVLEAEQYIPNDPTLNRLSQQVARYIHIISKQPQTDIYFKPYTEPNSSWRYLGTTPADSFRFPVGFYRIKLEKEGYETLEDIAWVTPFISDTLWYELSEPGSIPANMRLIPDKANWYDISSAPANIHIPSLEGIDRVQVGDFLMDTHEVSNSDFKHFIDGGGYENPAFWKHTFYKEGRQLSWEEAMKYFVDQTGHQGPPSWIVGDYPDGHDDLPVQGVSWYEAAAYAEFVGKSLPTVFHWDRAAFTYGGPVISAFARIANNEGPVPIASTSSANRFGVFNLSGNVREWIFNETNSGQRFIMGGGWDDPQYSFFDAHAQNPFNRDATNGFRCISYLPETENREPLEKIIKTEVRDFLSEKPVSTEVFEVYLDQFKYDKKDLDEEVEFVEENEDWTLEKVTFNTAYGNERMSAYLFLPKRGTPPYQTVVYFPGSYALFARSSDQLVENMKLANNEMFLKSGRAFLYPIYKSTYERFQEDDMFLLGGPTETTMNTISWKDRVIMWGKDLSRSLDYLESRNDIDNNNIAYYGFSWGGTMGGIYLATEKRIKASVLYVTGLLFPHTPPEVEMINYLPRVNSPVLMINGKQDFFRPYETAQVPFYELLGTDHNDKQLFSIDGGHTVPRSIHIEKTLGWLDTYLGSPK